MLKLRRYWPWKILSSHFKLWFQISILRCTLFLLNLFANKYFDFFKTKLKWRSFFFYKTQYQIHYELRRFVKSLGKTEKQTLPSHWRNPPNRSSPPFLLLLSQILSTFTIKYKWIWIPNYQPVFHQRINYFFLTKNVKIHTVCSI